MKSLAFINQEGRRKPFRAGGYLPFALPTLVVAISLVIIPFGYNAYLSLFRWRGGLAPKTFIGFDNYVRLLGDEQFWISFRNSIAMIIAIVVIPTLVGVVLAAVLFDYIVREFGGKVANSLRATVYLPQILPIAAVGIMWSWILSAQNGAINITLSQLGVDDLPNWLGDFPLALVSIMAVLIWGQIGFAVVIFMAALQRVDPELYEAATLDGAGWTARFRHITIPQIKPEIYVVTLTATIYALKVFAPILLLTKGGPEGTTYVPSYYAYYNFFSKSVVGYGAAISNVLTLLILAVVIVILAMQTRSQRREAAGV